MPFERGNVNWKDFINSWRAAPADFQQSIADIVDNALDVGAENVTIEFHLHEDRTPSVAIYDDGPGFSDLKEAFDLGNPPDYVRHERAAGKYHVGLKKSAITVCKQLTVLTIPPGEEEISHRRLTYEELEKNDDWGSDGTPSKTYIRRTHFYDQAMSRLQSGEYRTAILLDAFDRITFTPTKEDEDIETTHKTEVSRLRVHLGLVFSRRLEIGLLHDGAYFYKSSSYRTWYLKRLEKFDDEMKRPNIIINRTGVSTKVESIDPFYSHLEYDNVVKLKDNVQFSDSRQKISDFLPWHTIRLRETIEWKGHDVEINAFIIPKNDFVGTGKFQLPSKLKEPSQIPSGVSILKPDMEGLYFFRNDRLIAYGTKGLNTKRGWYATTNPEANTQDMRISIDVPKELDEEFKLADIKNGYEPPSDFFKELKKKLWENKTTFPKSKPNGSKQLSFYNRGVKRYQHSIQNKEKCSLCNGVHPEEKCPERSCDKCRLVGHTIKECTRPDCSTPGCLDPSGHITSACPRCRCGRRGHTEDQCTYRCEKCKEYNPDHTLENCPNCPYCSRSKEACSCKPITSIQRDEAGSITSIDITDWKVPEPIISWISENDPDG